MRRRRYQAGCFTRLRPLDFLGRGSLAEANRMFRARNFWMKRVHEDLVTFSLYQKSLRFPLTVAR